MIMMVNRVNQKPLSCQTCNNDFAPECFYTLERKRLNPNRYDRDGRKHRERSLKHAAKFETRNYLPEDRTENTTKSAWGLPHAE